MNPTAALVAIGSGFGLLIVAAYLNRQLLARGAKRPLVIGVWLAPPAAVTLSLLSSLSVLPPWPALAVAAVLVAGCISPGALIRATGGPVSLARVYTLVSRIGRACRPEQLASRGTRAASEALIRPMLAELKAQAPPELEAYVREYTTVVNRWLEGAPEEVSAEQIEGLTQAHAKLARQLEARGIDVRLLGT